MDKKTAKRIIRETVLAVENWDRKDVEDIVKLGTPFEAAMEALCGHSIWDIDVSLEDGSDESEGLRSLFAAGALLGFGTPIDWPEDMASDNQFIAMDIEGRVLSRWSDGNHIKWSSGDQFEDYIEAAKGLEP